jgi:hypothetical protein
MNARYQEWLKHIFDHEVEVKKPQWYFGEDAPAFEASDDEITELLGQTFLNAGKDLTKYTDEQVDQGIWYLASSSGSNFLSVLKSVEVPLVKRVEAIESISNLYSDCFAKRCAESLGHLSEEGSPLNSSCYMFWDISPLTFMKGASEIQEIQNAVLSVLQQILTIEHRACRESALHGLSELTFACPEKVREIIDGFLKDTKLDDRLLAYAVNARDGNVL